MRIAVMLRAIDEIDGPGIATTNLVDKIIELDRYNEYLVIYMREGFSGRYADYDNVMEHVLKSRSKVIYDQIYVPWFCRQNNVDLIFNTKFSVPLVGRRKSVVIQRGSEYWIYPEYYDRLDLMYVNTFLPLYCRKADVVITLSDVLKGDLHRFIGVPLEKMQTVYSAPHERFRVIDDADYLESIRSKLRLPKGKFILAVTKPYAAVGSANKKFYPGKNTEGVVRAFDQLKRQSEMDISLVLLGKDVRETWVDNYGVEALERGDVYFPGYVPQEDMPAVYNMATLLAFPSVYESFGIPLVEAMACGCPVLTARAGACPEIVGDAGVIVDFHDSVSLTAAMKRIAKDEDAALRYSKRGLNRAGTFSWEKSARQVVSIFSSLEV